MERPAIRVGIIEDQSLTRDLLRTLLDESEGYSAAGSVITLLGEFRAPHIDYELSPHELRLLKLLVEGHTYTTAAAELKFSTHTVSFRLGSVYEKLHVRSKSEALTRRCGTAW